MVTGRVPFDGDSAVTIAVKHLQEEMVPPETYCKNLPYSLSQIIKKTTEKSPDRRYQDIGDLIADLKQSLMDPDGDFVKMINPDDQARTVIVTKDTTAQVKDVRRAVRHKVDEEEDEEDDEEDDDDERLSPAVEKAMTAAGIVLAIIIVVIVFLLVSRLFGLGSGNSSNSDDTQTEESLEDEEEESSSANTVEMPSLLGMTMTEAKIELEELGLSITLKGSEASSEYASGQIINQSVEEGSRVEVGSSVEVITSSGVDSSTTTSEAEEEEESTVTVPNVLDKDEATARSALTAAGLTVGTVSESSSDSVEEGLVISQSVAANSTVEKGTSVDLVISSGPQTVTVTDVIGHEQARATSELEADGFKVSVTEAYSDDIRSGLVISTDPDRGTSAAVGSTVTITVSLGKQAITIPSVVVNMTYDSAVTALRNAGFTGTITQATEYSSSVGAGYVTRFSPSSTVDYDGEVTIYVSLGPSA